MIKLFNVNKYFNKNKANQNHVSKDINLEFGDTGFVVILGNSGSGKTTLLNIISGMDKFNNGTVEFNNQIFNKYKSNKWDLIRKSKIGYIFQNYHLLKELTVYENIKMVLNMNGVTDETEIKRRVQYLLSAVGMDNYQDRLAKQLSGGQQQRVAFARALSKNPQVILADEPTGNLDSKTTIELMNILKRVSKDKLVIMVTHEQALADFYADRIIEIENGKIIKDRGNVNKDNISIIQEQIIYLKDFDQTKMESEHVDLLRYTDKTDDKRQKLKVELIERKDTLYVKVDSKRSRRVKYIDTDSEIELVNESSKNIKDPRNETFTIEPIKDTEKQNKQNAITIKDSFAYALRKINVLSYGGKMLYVVLGLVGVIISISVGLIGETFRIEESYATQNRNYISVNTENIPYSEIMALEDVEGIEQVMFISRPVTFKVHHEKYYEVANSISVPALPIDIEFFDETSIIYGNMPEGYEIIIDKSIADRIIKFNTIRGIETYDDILDCSFKLQTSGSDEDYNLDSAIFFNISGIAEDNSNSVWMAEELMYSLVTPMLVDYEILGDYFEISQGTLPPTNHQVMISSHSSFLDDGVMPYSVGIATGEYGVSGVFEYIKDGMNYDFSKVVITNGESIKHEYFRSNYAYKGNFEFLLYSTDVKISLGILNSMGYDASNIYLYEMEYSQEQKLIENNQIYILSISGVIISGISIYFIMRSSLISRVYEVSVYRSLGAPKRSIRKMFLVEILLTTTISAIVGYIVMMLLLLQTESTMGDDVNIVHYTFFTFSLGLIGLYIINITFGFIPINVLLHKSPSEIINKYDL